MNTNPFDKNNFKITDARKSSNGGIIEGEIVIIGSGAGGGVAAENFAKMGFNVVLLEEGSLKTSKDFNMKEDEAYPELYQESASRRTLDKGIKILQGKAVGGGTTINWTSSFRTPRDTLRFWEKEFNISNFKYDKLIPHFEKIEKKFNINKWDAPPNENNEVLSVGLNKLGLSKGIISRNVKDCMNLGFCGMGCPVNAKQSTLVSSIPNALNDNAHLVHNLRAIKFKLKNDEVTSVICEVVNNFGHREKQRIEVKGKYFISCGGAIGTPSLLLRSSLPDPFSLIGKRTFLHPVSVSASLFNQKIEASYGAPQVVYSDHFLDSRSPNGPAGYKLETPPIHPVILASFIPEHGKPHREIMEQFPHLQVLIALQRDGFHPESVGGKVALKNDGSPYLDYPITKYMWEGIQDSYLKMAEIQFAAGAKKVIPIHTDSEFYFKWSEAKRKIKELPMKIHRARLISAHVMGGARLNSKESDGVVDENGKFHHLNNLYVMDGSLFPTSLGANPMETILTFVDILSSELANKLKK